MRWASASAPAFTAAKSSAWRSATTLPMPEMQPSAPRQKLAISDTVNEDSIATGRAEARSARRFFSYDTMSLDQSLTPTTAGGLQRSAGVSAEDPRPWASGHSKAAGGRIEQSAR